MKTVTDLWQVIMDELKQHLSSTSISIWFDEVIPVKQEGSNLYLYCPNDFKRENLERFYLQHLQKALMQSFSSEVSVSFLSRSEYAAALDPSSSSRRKPLRQSDKFTFDSFVVGPSNQMAYNAAQAVAAGFDEFCNPLVLYGPPGLGKTHLLNAIAASIQASAPDVRVVSIRGDQFTNELIDSIKTDSNAQFRQKYRTAPVFLMDDAHFIAGKKQTQEEFYNTFDALYQNGCSIVLTMDCPPGKLNRLDERITSRCEGGLLVEIAPPEYETRLEIVKRKAQERGLLLQPGQAEYIAEKVTGSVRKLEGTLNNLKALGPTVSTDQFEQLVERMVGAVPTPETPEQVIDRVARAFHVDAGHIKGKSRCRNVVTARQAAMYILCQEQGLTTSRVGSLMGRDHSTVTHSIQTVAEKMEHDETFARSMKKLISSLPRTQTPPCT